MSGYDASEWEPGDVASLTIVGRAGTKQVAAMRGKDGWYYPTPSGLASNFDSASTVIDARRLVVIDPEDAEQVERFREIASRWADDVPYDDGPGDLNYTTAMQAALREYANPTPRIEEPQGLGAVVEDAEGRLWVRKGNTEHGEDWSRQIANAWTGGGWDRIKAVRVLSEGVTS